MWLLQAASVWQMANTPDLRYRIYRAAGEWLRVHTPPTAAVGSLEVGIMGYHSERRMVDFAGLIQPVVARQFTFNATYQDSARWAIEHYRPQYLVLDPMWFPGMVASHCSPHQQLSGDAYGYKGRLVIYRCP
jgi:hypothetical protein